MENRTFWILVIPLYFPEGQTLILNLNLAKGSRFYSIYVHISPWMQIQLNASSSRLPGFDCFVGCLAFE